MRLLAAPRAKWDRSLVGWQVALRQAGFPTGQLRALSFSSSARSRSRSFAASACSHGQRCMKGRTKLRREYSVA
jgi:hypothetical protein